MFSRLLIYFLKKPAVAEVIREITVSAKPQYKNEVSLQHIREAVLKIYHQE